MMVALKFVQRVSLHVVYTLTQSWWLIEITHWLLRPINTYHIIFVVKPFIYLPVSSSILVYVLEAK